VFVSRCFYCGANVCSLRISISIRVDIIPRCIGVRPYINDLAARWPRLFALLSSEKGNNDGPTVIL